MNETNFAEPRGETEVASMPYNPPEADVTGIAAVRDKHAPELMAVDGVEGIAIGQDAIGNEALVVYLRTDSMKSQIPSQIEGHPVVTVVTGHIDAYGSRPG